MFLSINNKINLTLCGMMGSGKSSVGRILAKKINYSFYDKTKVTFYDLNDNLIDYYIENFNPYDKAGGYGIQDWSKIFIKEINGCYYNVIGLPIPKLFKIFEAEKQLNNLINKKQ